MNIKLCDSYIISYLDVFKFPIISVINNNLCSTQDKTRLFIISIIRCMIYYIISYHIDMLNISIIKLFFDSLVLLSIGILVIVFIKEPKYNIEVDKPKKQSYTVNKWFFTPPISTDENIAI